MKDFINIIHMLTPSLISALVAFGVMQITLKHQEKQYEEGELKKRTISAFLLYTDIVDKMLSIQNTLKYHSEENMGKTKEIHIYSTFNSTLNMEDIERHMSNLAGSFEIQDFLVIRYIYRNYEICIAPIDKKMKVDNKEKLEIEIINFKNNLDLVNDEGDYNRITNYYEYLRMEREEINLTLDKLREIIEHYQGDKENSIETNAFRDYIKVDLSKTRKELNGMKLSTIEIDNNL